jgi:hypothetical protein
MCFERRNASKKCRRKVSLRPEFFDWFRLFSVKSGAQVTGDVHCLDIMVAGQVRGSPDYFCLSVIC